MEREGEYLQRRREAFNSILRKILETTRVDCNKGCAYCCYGVTLWLRKVEAQTLVEFMNCLPLKERKRLAVRLREYEKTYREEAKRNGYAYEGPLDEEDLQLEKLSLIGGLAMNEVPCPFLREDSTCSVYDARPDMCRLMVSPSKELCKKDWENPLSLIWRKDIAPFVEEIRSRFRSQWSLHLLRLRREFPDLEADKMENKVAFIGYWIRFDPVRKVFKLRT